MTNTNEIVKFTDERGELVQFSAQDIKARLCPNIDDKELALVLGLCKAQRLNPFNKDVYIIKYGNSPASIVTSKEVFTKRANSNPDFEGFDAGIVYINSQGEVCTREGSAVYKAANEQLVGGWCRVHVKGRRPFYDEVTLEEYSTGKSGWAKMPATMIRKVALVHCLREAFPDDFQGLYAAEEMGNAGEKAQIMEEQAETVQQPEHVQQVQEAPQQVHHASVDQGDALQAEFYEVASDSQMQVIDRMCVQLARFRGVSAEDVRGWLYASNTMRGLGVTEGAEMTPEQAQAAAVLLGRWIAKATQADSGGADC